MMVCTITVEPQKAKDCGDYQFSKSKSVIFLKAESLHLNHILMVLHKIYYKANL